jgi:ACS family tartrate transporter-like MFS transporter
MQGADTNDELERVTMRQVAWRLLPFLLLLYIISWLDRVNVGFAKLQMNDDLGFSETIYGIGAGIEFLVRNGFGAAQPVAGEVRRARVDRANHDHVGIISIGMMFVQGVYSFYVMRSCWEWPRRDFCPASSIT